MPRAAPSDRSPAAAVASSRPAWPRRPQRGSTSTNYQIMPGDRIYVDAKKWVRFDTGMARFLSPFERVLGITLLGSETVNSISGRTTGTGGIP